MNEKSTKLDRAKCGFCQDNNHAKCIGGVLNGNKVEVVVCPCDCGTPKLRCLKCNSREYVNEGTWECEEGCTTISEILNEDNTVIESTRCLCCDEPTKGGRFLPGHDTRYLVKTLAKINEGTCTLSDAMKNMVEAGCSVKLSEKLIKLVGSNE